MAFIDTPQTDAGNATYLAGPNMPLEGSFISPVKKQDDLMHQMRNRRGHGIQTPGMRPPLRNRDNLQTRAEEFTPLLKSAPKRGAVPAGNKRASQPHTPAFLKDGYRAKDSPGLNRPESSLIYADESGSYLDGRDDRTPLPQPASSSVQSTPLAVLPKNGEGPVVADGANALSLREQEAVRSLWSFPTLHLQC
jgi:hypothetical protein